MAHGFDGRLGLRHIPATGKAIPFYADSPADLISNELDVTGFEVIPVDTAGRIDFRQCLVQAIDPFR